MKELVEVAWVDDSGDEPKEMRQQCYLLHFGIRSEIIDTGDGRLFGVSNTICVCQNVKTGQLEGWPIESIRIIGTELKK